jgi:histidyl-tRNA synthetase
VRYRSPRGTQDILPELQPYWQHVIKSADDIASIYNYKKIDTPMFEDTDLYLRGVGEGTDIVEKEMYTFLDRGGDSLTLRPEGTASICRAYIEHGMHTLPQPVRLYYIAPAFRYERPQRGRFRQHHQFGLEAIGDASPIIDAEIIELAYRYLYIAGVSKMQFMINNIGDKKCRPMFINALLEFYEKKLDEVCGDCKERYRKNPLRLLDCKRIDYSCQQMIDNSPHTIDYLCSECDEHWKRLLTYLDRLDIDYIINPRLVRGLDYYTKTVFEVHPQESGSQTALLGGGRYDGLMEEIGSRSVPGIGFGSGIERIVNQLQNNKSYVVDDLTVDAVMIHIGLMASLEVIKIASNLRKEGLRIVIAPDGRSLRGQMRYAESINALYVVIIGQNELDLNIAQVKNMNDGTQKPFSINDLSKTSFSNFDSIN